MQTLDAVTILSALGQTTRLETFRLLIRSGPEGMAASGIASAIGVPRNTMSAHLSILADAGLVESERLSRHVFYRPSIARLSELISFLVEGCCGGQPDLCGAAELEVQLAGIAGLR